MTILRLDAIKNDMRLSSRCDSITHPNLIAYFQRKDTQGWLKTQLDTADRITITIIRGVPLQFPPQTEPTVMEDD